MYARFLTIKEVIVTVRDFLLGVSPWIPAQGKYGVRSLRAQEVRNAMAQGVPGAEITRLNIEETDRGTTDRTRVNLEWNEVGRKAGLPTSVFTKGTPSKIGSRVIISMFHCHTYESRFYKELQKSIPDLAIRPYISRWGTGGRFIIAFEDVTGRGDVQMYTCADEAPLSHVEAVIDLLAKLHGHFWDSPRFNTDLSWIKTNAQRQGHLFMPPFFKWSEKRFMAQDREVPTPVRRLTKQYVENQETFVRIWEAMTPTLCHGDCHLGNTFSNPDGTAVIYDWQVFHKMNGLRDFAYFMMHSVPTETRRAHEGTLLKRYLDGLAQAGVRNQPAFDDAWEAYRLLTIDGWIAIVFTLALGGLQPDEWMEVTAVRAIHTMMDLDLAGAIDRALRS
jgi:aminoglycoside phosphotransferase (APT) family kinase protein